MKQTWIKAGKWMLVVLFLSYYISATCCFHTHYYSWGTVTHSHFYYPFGENAAQHNHTQNQCQTIHFLSNLILTFLIATTFFKITRVSRLYIPVYRYTIHLLCIASPLRAPPGRR